MKLSIEKTFVVELCYIPTYFIVSYNINDIQINLLRNRRQILTFLLINTPTDRILCENQSF